MTEALSVLRLDGLVPRSLGTYLATLGLLRLAHRGWVDARLAWRDDVPVLVGVPSLDALAEHLVALLETDALTRYGLFWQVAQKAATKEKRVDELLRWEAQQPEDVLDLYRAHLVANKTERPLGDKSGDDRAFNPLLGSGGNAGKRRFDKGWEAARDALLGGGKKRKKDAPTPHGELIKWLRGEPLGIFGDYQTASWFMETNKRFNQGWSGEDHAGVSPWAMLCACEALPLFGGATSKRLGARARAVPAFPFVTAGSAPQSEVELKAQSVKAELWLPLWSRPMVSSEVEALFARSRAEVGHSSAGTPALFAAAVMQRGVDSGVREFRRFLLLKTTSANTFESRLEQVVPLLERVGRPESVRRDGKAEAARAVAVERLAILYEALPRDEAKRFRGYRGGLEQALVRLAEDGQNPELGWRAVDAAFGALVALDRNGAVRSGRVRWPLMPRVWLEVLSSEGGEGSGALTLAQRVARALATIGWKGGRTGGRTLRPLLRYRLGVAVELRDGVAWARLVEPRPASVVMGGLSLEADLVAALRRILVEASAETDPHARRAMWTGALEVSAEDLAQWLSDDTLDDEVRRWLERFMLFEWHTDGRRKKAAAVPETADSELLVAALLQAVLRVEDLRAAVDGVGDNDAERAKRPEARQGPLVASVLARLVANDLHGALEKVRQRMMARGVPVPKALVENVELDETRRLAASLLIPMEHDAIARLTRRWVRPGRVEN